MQYYPNSTFDYSKLDEISIIPQYNQNFPFTELKKIVKKYPKININFHILSKQKTDFQILKAIYDTHKNIKLVFNYKNDELKEYILSLNIPYFFSNFINHFDELQGVITQYNPTDVYICEELGFFLDKISPLVHEKNIKIRVFPNICQSNYPGTPSIKTFFIRPDDISEYSNYIDVFELLTDDKRQGIIYKIYAEDQTWSGKITEIIPSFNRSFPQQADTPYFYASLDAISSIRPCCKKRCMYSLNSCAICDRLVDLSLTATDKKLKN